MDIEEKVRIKNANSALWQMILAASEGTYKEKLATKEGKEELFNCYQQELDHIANVAFNKGRAYEAKKK